jgi:hypothetical protein
MANNDISSSPSSYSIIEATSNTILVGSTTGDNLSVVDDEFGDFETSTTTLSSPHQQQQRQSQQSQSQSQDIQNTKSMGLSSLQVPSSSSTACAAPASAIVNTNNSNAEKPIPVSSYQSIDLLQHLTAESIDNNVIIKQGPVYMMRLGGFPTKKMQKKEVRRRM